MKNTIHRVLSLILLCSPITLLSMDNGLPKPDLSCIERNEQPREFAALKPSGSDSESSDSEDDYEQPNLRKQFLQLKKQLRNNPALRPAIKAALRQLKQTAQQQQHQKLVRKISTFLNHL